MVLYTVGAKINFPFPFLNQQEKCSRTDHTVGVPCLLYALRIFSNHIFGIETTSKTRKHVKVCFIWNSKTVNTKPASHPFGSRRF